MPTFKLSSGRLAQEASAGCEPRGAGNSPAAQYTLMEPATIRGDGLGMTDRVTLITGASSGIGAELARVFASKGHRLALVDRRAERLTTLAGEIATAGGSAPILIPCDLSHPDACDRIAAALAAKGVEVEFVINNAGFGLFGRAIELDRAEQLAIIAVNILALTDLSLRFSDSLIRHQAVSSTLLRSPVFCRVPEWRCIMPPRVMFCPSVKRCARNLLRCGVRVTTLCPGSVSTEFQARAGIKPGFEHQLLDIAASDVAQAGYLGLMANKRIVLPGLGTKIIPFLLRLFPRGFILAAIGHLQLRKHN